MVRFLISISKSKMIIKYISETLEKELDVMRELFLDASKIFVVSLYL